MLIICQSTILKRDGRRWLWSFISPCKWFNDIPSFLSIPCIFFELVFIIILFSSFYRCRKLISKSLESSFICKGPFCIEFLQPISLFDWIFNSWSYIWFAIMFFFYGDLLYREMIVIKICKKNYVSPKCVIYALTIYFFRPIILR